MKLATITAVKRLEATSDTTHLVLGLTILSDIGSSPSRAHSGGPIWGFMGIIFPGLVAPRLLSIWDPYRHTGMIQNWNGMAFLLERMWLSLISPVGSTCLHTCALASLYLNTDATQLAQWLALYRPYRYPITLTLTLTIRLLTALFGHNNEELGIEQMN